MRVAVATLPMSKCCCVRNATFDPARVQPPGKTRRTPWFPDPLLPLMHSSRHFFFLLLGLTAVFVAGCGRKEVTSLQRKQAASLVSEADFALSVRDYPRAEGLLTQAVAACPDTPDYWLKLGAVRRRLGNRAGAKAAYEEILDLAKANFKRNAKDTQPLLQQIYALALLGRMDDARAVLEKAKKHHPDDRNIRKFVEDGSLDHLPDDPAFKDMAL